MPKKGEHVLPLGKIKSFDLWKLDFDFRKNLKDNSECARTMGYYFTSGVVNWRQWCQCRNNCGKKWTYGWITNLRAKYLQQTKADQLITLMQLVVKENNKYKYQLMDSTKKKHQVCHHFFCKVYQISVTTILKKLEEKKDQPISSSPEKKHGIWNRDENWKGKVSVTTMMDWIKKQPKEFSHYTRRLDQKSKKYFVDIHSIAELFNKYTLDMLFEDLTPMKKSSFYKYFKLLCKKKCGIKKNHLDVCTICTKIKIFKKKIQQKANLKQQLEELQEKHLFEADTRYAKWKKDKLEVQQSFSSFENEVIEHSKWDSVVTTLGQFSKI
jgi:hypothetical protein